MQRLAAYGILVDAGSLLLVRASSMTEVPGRWFLPGGGVDHGEHPEQALARELEEETGLRSPIEELLGVLSDVRRRRDGTDLHTVRLIYRLGAPSGSIRSEITGTSDLARFVPIDELGELPIAVYVRKAADLAGLRIQSVK